MTSENADSGKGLALSGDDERQVRDFIANIPKFNSVMGELSRMMDEGQIEALSHALAALRFVKEGLNDEAVESLSKMGGTLIEVASSLSSTESRKMLQSVSNESSELSSLVEQIGKMHRDGVFEAVVSAAYAIKFLRDGLNDEAVENAATSLSDMMAVWRQYSSIVTNPELMAALTKVSKMERDGALEAVIEGAYVMKFLRDGLNDEALTNITTMFAEILRHWHELHHLLDLMSSPTAERVLRMLSDEQVIDRLEQATPRKGGMSMLTLSDPDMRKGMGVVFELLRVIGEEFKTDGKK